MDSSRSFPRRLASFASLNGAERWLTLRAVGWLAVARVALHIVPFARLQAFVESRSATGDASPDGARQVRRAMSRAARTLPGSRCLARALAALLLLRRGGSPARLVLGVAPDAGCTLRAHAWVESDGFIVVGDGEHEEYRPLVAGGA